MRTSKMSLVVMLTLALSLGLAASSWARPFGGGMGCGMMGGMNLNAEQAGKLFDLKEKFRNDTAELRKQMWIKRTEMAALWKAEKPDEKAIAAKQKEMNALRDQMQQKGIAFHLEARKIAPQMGMGPGGGMCAMGGPGGGMGPGGGAGPGGPAK
jgi:zinc resistance-associated protein